MVVRALSVSALALFASSCGDSPSGLDRDAHVTGSVVLVQTLSSMDGCTTTGLRIVDDADSCRVYLIRGRELIATTYTSNGSYIFASVPRGNYQSAVGLWPCLSDTSRGFIVDSDLVVPDTLRLGRVGSISNCPNPFAARDGAKLSFGPGFTGFYSVDLTSLSGSSRHRIWQGQTASGIRNIIVWGIISGDPNQPLLGHHLITLSIGPDSSHAKVVALDVVTLQRPRNHDVP